MPTEKVKRTQKGAIPLPKFQIVRDSGVGRNAWKLFDHWLKIPKEHIELVQVRIYRTWPEIDLRQVDKDLREHTVEILTGACPFEDPHGYMDWFRERYGCGGYRVQINEAGVPGEIMRAYFEDREEMDKYPPKLDLRTLIRGAEANKYYEAWCHRNNTKLPWENDDNEGDDNMGGTGSATGDALRTMVDSHTKLAERNIDLAERVAEARVEAAENANASPDPRDEAHSKSLEMVTNTANRMVEMATERSGKQYDTVEILRAAKDLMHNDGETPRGTGDLAQIIDVVQRSNDRVITLYEKQADMMASLFQGRAPGAGAVEPAKSFADQAREYRTIAELFGWAGGGGKAVATTTEPAAAAPAQPHWFNENTAPIIMMGFQTGLLLIANIAYNWSVAKFKPEGQTPQNPADVLKQATQATQMAQNGNAPDPPQPTQAETDAAMWKQFITDLEGPFIAHFYVDPPAKPAGYTLALFVQSDGTMQGMTQNGRNNYLALRRLGKKHFDMLVRGHDSLWNKVKGQPQAYEKFLNEFFTYDEYVQEQAAKTAQAKAPATTP